MAALSSEARGPGGRGRARSITDDDQAVITDVFGCEGYVDDVKYASVAIFFDDSCSSDISGCSVGTCTITIIDKISDYKQINGVSWAQLVPTRTLMKRMF